LESDKDRPKHGLFAWFKNNFKKCLFDIPNGLRCRPVWKGLADGWSAARKKFLKFLAVKRGMDKFPERFLEEGAAEAGVKKNVKKIKIRLTVMVENGRFFSVS
jgi:hypothetical protein